MNDNYGNKEAVLEWIDAVQKLVEKGKKKDFGSDAIPELFKDYMPYASLLRRNPGLQSQKVKYALPLIPGLAQYMR